MEEQCEEYAYHESIACEDIPACRPVAYGASAGYVVVRLTVDDGLRSEGTYGGAYTVGHQHEESLRT